MLHSLTRHFIMATIVGGVLGGAALYASEKACESRWSTHDTFYSIRTGCWVRDKMTQAWLTETYAAILYAGDMR